MVIWTYCFMLATVSHQQKEWFNLFYKISYLTKPGKFTTFTDIYHIRAIRHAKGQKSKVKERGKTNKQKQNKTKPKNKTKQNKQTKKKQMAGWLDIVREPYLGQEWLRQEGLFIRWATSEFGKQLARNTRHGKWNYYCYRKVHFNLSFL